MNLRVLSKRFMILIGSFLEVNMVREMYWVFLKYTFLSFQTLNKQPR